MCILCTYFNPDSKKYPSWLNCPAITTFDTETQAEYAEWLTHVAGKEAEYRRKEAAATKKRAHQRRRDTLAPEYVAKTLRMAGLPVTPEFVEAQRERLQIVRLTRHIEKELQI